MHRDSLLLARFRKTVSGRHADIIARVFLGSVNSTLSFLGEYFYDTAWVVNGTPSPYPLPVGERGNPIIVVQHYSWTGLPFTLLLPKIKIGRAHV